MKNPTVCFVDWWHVQHGRSTYAREEADAALSSRRVESGEVFLTRAGSVPVRNETPFGVRIAPEPAEEILHLFMQHRMHRHAMLEILQLRGSRQVAIQKQVADFQEMRLLCQLVDGKAAVQQHALVAVDEGYRTVAGRGRGEAGIIGEDVGLSIELADVDDIRSGGPRQNRHFDRLAIQRKCRGARLLGCSVHRRPSLYGARARVSALGAA